jgi:hypothetical protein
LLAISHLGFDALPVMPLVSDTLGHLPLRNLLLSIVGEAVEPVGGERRDHLGRHQPRYLLKGVGPVQVA